MLVSVELEVGVGGVTVMVFEGLAERFVVVRILCDEAIDAIEKEENLGTEAAIGESFGEGNFTVVKESLAERDSIDAIFSMFCAQCALSKRGSKG